MLVSLAFHFIFHIVFHTYKRKLTKATGPGRFSPVMSHLKNEGIGSITMVSVYLYWSFTAARLILAHDVLRSNFCGFIARSRERGE